VQHLGEWYAQSHPTEDFAETFAVWLTPRSGWQRRYASWPALRKLNFVQQFAGELGTHNPPVRSRDRIEPVDVNQHTLAQYYRRRLARERSRRGLLADRLLQRVFRAEPGRRALTAATLLRTHKARLRAGLIRDTGVDRYLAHQILRIAIDRGARLRLYVQGPQRDALRRLAPCCGDSSGYTCAAPACACAHEAAAHPRRRTHQSAAPRQPRRLQRQGN